MAASKRCQTLQPLIACTAILVSLLCNGMIISIQANISDEVWVGPAKLENIPMTYYGILFGIFKLTVFVSSTLIGKSLSSFGMRKVFMGGLVMTGTMAISCGFLNNNPLFILTEETMVPVLTAVRIIGAVGTTAFLTASFAIVGDLFCHSLGTGFSIVQMFLAIGILIGQQCISPLIGPFLAIQLLGCALMSLTIISSLVLPSFKNSDALEGNKNFGIVQALKTPTIALSALSVFAASIAIGTLHTTPDQHLSEEIKLTTPQIGNFFMMYTGACAMVTPFWGLMSDKVDPKYVILLGSLLTSAGFVLLGPTPLTGLSASHSLSLVSVVLAGSGIGAQLVASFTEAQRSAVANGFPADISTSFLMSSIWTAAFALGAFLGPVTAGLLFDNVGFAWSTLFVVGWNILVCFCTLCLLFSLKNNEKEEEIDFNDETKCLLNQSIGMEDNNIKEYQAVAAAVVKRCP